MNEARIRESLVSKKKKKIPHILPYIPFPFIASSKNEFKSLHLLLISVVTISIKWN